MKKTLVAGFGDFLTSDTNSSEEFIKQLPDNKKLTKILLPAGYFKKSLIKPIKKNKPQKVVFLGMHEGRKKPMFEVVANNRKITLKKPVYRFGISMYSHVLRVLKKNLRIKKEPSKKDLIILPIEKKGPQTIKLQSKPPKKGIGLSMDAGYFVCNYAMWIVERFLRKQSKDVEFYFIHIPKKLSSAQKKMLEEFILSP